MSYNSWPFPGKLKGFLLKDTRKAEGAARGDQRTGYAEGPFAPVHYKSTKEIKKSGPKKTAERSL
jgi:hypothetical protein